MTEKRRTDTLQEHVRVLCEQGHENGLQLRGDSETAFMTGRPAATATGSQPTIGVVGNRGHSTWRSQSLRLHSQPIILQENLRRTWGHRRTGSTIITRLSRRKRSRPRRRKLRDLWSRFWWLRYLGRSRPTASTQLRQG